MEQNVNDKIKLEELFYHVITWVRARVDLITPDGWVKC